MINTSWYVLDGFWYVLKCVPKFVAMFGTWAIRTSSVGGGWLVVTAILAFIMLLMYHLYILYVDVKLLITDVLAGCKTAAVESLLGLTRYKALVNPQTYENVVHSLWKRCVYGLCSWGVCVLLFLSYAGEWSGFAWRVFFLVNGMVCALVAWSRGAIFQWYFVSYTVRPVIARVKGVWDTSNFNDPYLVIQHRGEVVHIEVTNPMAALLLPILSKQLPGKVQEAMMTGSKMQRLGRWPTGVVRLTHAHAQASGFVAVATIGGVRKPYLWTALHVLGHDDKLVDCVKIEHDGIEIEVKLTDDMVAMMSEFSDDDLDFVAVDLPQFVYSTLKVKSLKFAERIVNEQQVVRVSGPKDGMYYESSGRIRFGVEVPLTIYHECSTVPTWSGSPICLGGLVYAIHQGNLGGKNYGVCVAPLLNRTRRVVESDTVASDYLKEMSDADLIRDAEHFKSKYAEDDAMEYDLAYHERDSKGKLLKYKIHSGSRREGKPRTFAISGGERKLPMSIIRDIQSRVTDDLITEEQATSILDDAGEAARHGVDQRTLTEQVESAADEAEQVSIVARSNEQDRPLYFRTMIDKAKWMLLADVRPVYRSQVAYDRWADTITDDHPRVLSLVEALSVDAEQWDDVKAKPEARQQEMLEKEGELEKLSGVSINEFKQLIVANSPWTVGQVGLRNLANLSERLQVAAEVKTSEKKQEAKKQQKQRVVPMVVPPAGFAPILDRKDHKISKTPIPPKVPAWIPKPKVERKLESGSQEPMTFGDDGEDKKHSLLSVSENARGVWEAPVKSQPDVKLSSGSSVSEPIPLRMVDIISQRGWALLELDVAKQKLLQPSQRKPPSFIAMFVNCYLTKKQVKSIVKSLGGLPTWLRISLNGVGLFEMPKQS